MGTPIIVDPDGRLMGAFGAVLLAAVEPISTRKPVEGDATPCTMKSGELDFDALQEFDFETREIECNKCANHCEIICVNRDGKLIDS